MALITDTTLTKIKTELQRRNEKLKNFAQIYAATTWDQIQIDCKAMTREQLLTKYPIGTELVCQYTLDANVYDCPWVVLDARDCEWEDGTTHLGR